VGKKPGGAGPVSKPWKALCPVAAIIFGA